jgi:hypothetical protein
MSAFQRLFRHHLQLTLIFGTICMLLLLATIIGSSDPRSFTAAKGALFAAMPVALISFAWANRTLHVAEPNWGRRFLMTCSSALIDLAWLALIFIAPAGLMVYLLSGFTLRAQVSDMIDVTASYRNAIAEAAEKSGSLRDIGAGIKLKRTENIDYTYIDRDGTVIIYNMPGGVLVVLSPVFERGKITWRCFGLPERAMPPDCRAKPG